MDFLIGKINEWEFEEYFCCSLPYCFIGRYPDINHIYPIDYLHLADLWLTLKCIFTDPMHD